MKNELIGSACDWCNKPATVRKQINRFDSFFLCPEHQHRITGRTTWQAICPCDCGCEPDGEWHFEEIRCACVALGCPCVVDQPSERKNQ